MIYFDTLCGLVMLAGITVSVYSVILFIENERIEERKHQAELERIRRI